MPEKSLIHLTLPGYLTPSLNRLLGQHWAILRKEKARAKLALLSALREAHARSSTPTISQAVASLSSTNCATPSSLATTIRKPSKSSSAKKKSEPKPPK
jgi:hypothetical protein